MLSAQPERNGAGRDGVSRRVIGVATAVVLGVLVALGVATHRSSGNPNAIQPLDPYASRLPFSNLSLSEATSGTGGKVTYVDGQVANTGTRTVAGATLQVSFANSDGSVPHREIVPLRLIRTRDPYVDTQPVAAAPIPPGQVREFRLIFEDVPQSWNVQAPEIRLIHSDLK